MLQRFLRDRDKFKADCDIYLPIRISFLITETIHNIVNIAQSNTSTNAPEILIWLLYVIPRQNTNNRLLSFFRAISPDFSSFLAWPAADTQVHLVFFGRLCWTTVQSQNDAVQRRRINERDFFLVIRDLYSGITYICVAMNRAKHMN